MKPAFLFVLAALISGTGVPAGAAEPDRPNILWLVSEDNSARWLGCYGNPHARTPNLDGLAREGFRYTHAYANAPVCAPQRGTWITGVMALSMGTHHMRSSYPIPHDVIGYYPDALRASGYFTGNSKKTDYNIGGRSGAEAWDASGPVDWDALGQRQPFFQVINFKASHESSAFGGVADTTHDPADTTLARYHPDVPDMRKNYARYHDAVSRMDGQIGETLARLDAQGLAENTIVVYASDHGGVLPRSKRFLYRSGLHCPVILRIPPAYRSLWPADAPGGVVDRLVSFVDLPKTWLSLAGSSVPETMQGRVFLGPDAEPEPAVHLAFRGRMDERIDNARSVNDKRYLYIRNYMPYVPWMQKQTYLWNMEAAGAWAHAVADGAADAVQGRYFSPKGQAEELYDMQRDPDCVENLIESPEHQAVREQMRARLRERQLAIFDAGLLPETEMARLASDHGTTVYEMVRDPSRYDVAGLLDAADLALAQDPAHREALRGLLTHEHVGMRYWGVVGGFLLNDRAAGRAAAADPSHEVRAMAAWLLVRAGDKDAGLAVLTELIGQRSYALRSVLNVVDWMGADAEPLVPAIEALTLEEIWPRQYREEIRMRDIVLEKFAGAAPRVPAEVAARYQLAMDPGVSDDFDAIDPAKWEKRQSKVRAEGGGAAGNIKAAHNQIKSADGATFLSLLSSLDGEAGLSALHPHRYGFTVCRWRIRGVDAEKAYAAHPSIWAFSYNMGVTQQNAPNDNGKTVEIDWMEYIKWELMYHARAIPADAGISDVDRSAYMTHGLTDFDGWKTQGFEYTPAYVQMWEHDGDTWRTIGEPVRFVDEDVKKADGEAGHGLHKVAQDYRSDQYFILSNIWFYKPEYELTPVRLDIDYLHHYKMK